VTRNKELNNIYMRYSLFYLLLIIMLQPACKECPPCGEATVPPPNTIGIGYKEFSTPHIASFVKQHRPNYFYGFELLRKANEDYFAYITEDGSLAITSIQKHGQEKLISLKAYLRAKRYSPLVQIINDTLAIVNRDEKKFSYFKITDSFDLELKGTTALGTPEQWKGLEFTGYAFNNSFSFQYPLLLVPYIKVGKTVELDTYSHMLFNISSGASTKLIRVPARFKQCSIRDNSCSSQIKNNEVLCLFTQNDSLYRYSTDNTVLSQGVIQHHCQFQEFDRSKNGNLAYIRKYTATNESNIQLLIDDNKNFFVIKKNKTDSLKSPMTYSLFVFDSNFKQVYSNKIEQSLHYMAAFDAANGFLIFNDSLTKVYNYVTQPYHGISAANVGRR